MDVNTIEIKDFSLTRISNTDLSIQSKVALVNAGIITVGDLIFASEEKLHRIEGHGISSVQEILKKRLIYEQQLANENKSTTRENVTDSSIENFDEWIQSKNNQELVKKYLHDSEIGIDVLEMLSTKAFNLLQFAGLTQLCQIIFLDTNELCTISRMDAQTALEIKKNCHHYLRENKGKIARFKQQKEQDNIKLSYLKDSVGDELDKSDDIDELGIDFEFDPVEDCQNEDFFGTKKNINVRKNEGEHSKKIDRTQSLNVDKKKAPKKSPEKFELIRQQEEYKELYIFDMIKYPKKKKKLLKYVKTNDLALEQMDLSVRSFGALRRRQYENISDLILLEPSDFFQIKNLGQGSVYEILSKIMEYFKEHHDRINAYVNGDETALHVQEPISERILSLYETMGFRGLHLQDILEKLDVSKETEVSMVKHEIGKLIFDGELEYVDYRIYRVYPSFIVYAEQVGCVDVRGIQYIKEKLNGDTLEQIGEREGLTRERVRQIINKTGKKICSTYMLNTGCSYFDEDYYKHLYTNYLLGRKVCNEWLGIDNEVFNYLDFFYKKGNKNIEEALDDPEIDIGLKLKISNYLNRKKIYIDGRWIENNRSSLEDYVLFKFCKKDTSFEDFGKIYNKFLKKQGIPFNEDLYYTESVMRTRMSRLAESHNVLWKQYQMIRYYDIDSRDYTELLETLNLDSFENIDISTLKFIEDYPRLMKRYDIHDQYELHNLLRKIVPDGSYHDFHCGRMPGISFGKFNRDEKILEIVYDNAPISQQELVDLIHDELGYDKATIVATYLTCARDYCHMGIYTVDSIVMPDKHKQILSDALTEDFYFIDDVKRIYSDLISDANQEAVNAYNLKSIGFTMRSQYIIKEEISFEFYIKNLLIEQGISDIDIMRKKYRNLKTWYITLYNMKCNYEIIEFEPNQVISLKKLEKSGITKEDLKDFCDEVYNFAEDGLFFTMKYLKKKGFDSQLFDLGFDDWFYSNLLGQDPRFSYSNAMSNIIIYKGDISVSIKLFVTDYIKQVGVIDALDLINDLRNDFGCEIEKFDIMSKIKDTEVFYDPILDRLYANAELYYRELDEDME